MATKSEVFDLQVRSADDLCKLAEMLGYKDQGRFAINQMQCNNGAFVSSLLSFFEDNPGVMEAIHEWVLEQTNKNDPWELEDEEEECEQEEDEVDG